ncbi:MAG: hypothetical protein K2K74_00380 [Lachnospiraceae bacterium]|nr:hypothetical protein [Lachnospiraceae bacterium]
MKERFALIVVVIIISTGMIYKSNYINDLLGERNDYVQIKSSMAQESESIVQQSEKNFYHLKQGQFDKYADKSELTESALYREWLKKTTIFCIEPFVNENVLINDYLRQQGIDKTMPDNITYCNGQPFIKYYEDDESGKIAFVSTVFYDDDSFKYVYCGVAYIEDFEKEGRFIYDFDEEGRLLSEKLYNISGQQAVDISYTYKINIPFPIITKYDNSMGEKGGFFFSEYLNIGQRFWVYDRFLEFDEKDRWVKYNGNIYNDFGPEEGIESYNTPIYNEDDRLEKIIETLRGSRYQDNPDEWIEDGEIEFKYDDSGSLIEVNYHGFSGNHGSTGNTGTIYYDEYGRIVHVDIFHSSGNYHYFYLYRDNERYPFAIFKIGGMPYSEDVFDDYSTCFGMDFDAWIFLDE